MRTVRITNINRATILGDRVQVADSSLRRMWGLLGRRSLASGEGLWIRPSSGVHTVGMAFPIDVVGLDKSNRVLKLWPELPPFRVTSVSWAMFSVIELPAGQIAATSVQVGDQLSITP